MDYWPAAWCEDLHDAKNATALRLIAIVQLSDSANPSLPVDKLIAARRELHQAIQGARDDIERLAEELLNLPKG